MISGSGLPLLFSCRFHYSVKEVYSDQAEDKEQVTEPAKDNEQPTKQSHNDNKSQPEGNSQVVKEPSSEGKLPMTGDNSLITTWIVIMLIAVSGAFAVHAKVKKVNNSDLFIK